MHTHEKGRQESSSLSKCLNFPRSLSHLKTVATDSSCLSLLSEWSACPHVRDGKYTFFANNPRREYRRREEGARTSLGLALEAGLAAAPVLTPAGCGVRLDGRHSSSPPSKGGFWSIWWPGWFELLCAAACGSCLAHSDLCELPVPWAGPALLRGAGGGAVGVTEGDGVKVNGGAGAGRAAWKAEEASTPRAMTGIALGARQGE